MIDARGTEDLGVYFLQLEGLLHRIERSTNHYQVLGTARSATREEIGVAYRVALDLLSPTDLRDATLDHGYVNRINEALARISQAHLVLTQFGSRVEYDNSLACKVRVPIAISIPETTQTPHSSPKVEHSGTTHSSAEAAESGQSGTDESTGRSPSPANQRSKTSDNLKDDSEAISIKHGVGCQALYTKPIGKSEPSNRRRYHRLRLSVPTYVTGYDRATGKWTEVAHTLDVSVGGVALQLAQGMKEGTVLHLILPMPTKLRRHGHSDPTYQVYAIVRRTELTPDNKQIVGLEFLGGSPPPGYLEKPWAKFQTRW